MAGTWTDQCPMHRSKSDFIHVNKDLPPSAILRTTRMKERVLQIEGNTASSLSKAGVKSKCSHQWRINSLAENGKSPRRNGTFSTDNVNKEILRHAYGLKVVAHKSTQIPEKQTASEQAGRTFVHFSTADEGTQVQPEVKDSSVQAQPEVQDVESQAQPEVTHSDTQTQPNARESESQTEVVQIEYIHAGVQTQPEVSDREVRGTEVQTDSTQFRSFEDEQDPMWMRWVKESYHKENYFETLPETGDDHREIRALFMGSLKPLRRQIVQVVTIQRLHHMFLYKCYENKKAWMVKNKDHAKPVETRLWHGTLQEHIPRVMHNGLPMCWQDRHGELHEEGGYHRDADGCYEDSKPSGDGGDWYMFYCRCLTGDYIAEEVKSYPPIKQPGGSVRYDSTVAKNDPEYFTMYEASQTYPQYLIRFKVEWWKM